MRDIKIGTTLLLIGLFICVIENIYFGWNRMPMSDLELYLDNTVKVFMYVGFIFYTLPLWALYESAVKKHEAKK
jgi:hypothetical protein